MATRTSSPPGSRSKSTSSSRSSRSGSSRSELVGTGRLEHPIPEYAQGHQAPHRLRPGAGGRLRAPSATARGPVLARLRRAGSRARRRLDGDRPRARRDRPQHRAHRPRPRARAPARRGRAWSCSAWPWSPPPPSGGSCRARVMEVTRTIAAGSVGKVGWFLPLVLVLIGWRNMRDPRPQRPGRSPGRSAGPRFAFGVLGIVHIANGNPQPVAATPTRCETAGGAVGFVVSNLLLDLLRTPYVVVPLLVLLAFFGVLVITATPVYQVPTRLAEVRDRLLGRTRPEAEERRGRAHPADPHPPRPRRRRRHRPRHGRPGVRLARCSRTARSGSAARRAQPDPEAETDAFARRPGPRSSPEPEGRPRAAARTRRCRRASSSSRCPATSPTRCPPTRCSSPGRCTRPAPRPATRSSTG